MAQIGLVILAASSMLHVASAPLAELYNAPGATPEDRQAIEYAWHGAQSVFDTMLATGVLLVPIGMVLLGVAMSRTSGFSPRPTMLTIGLGTVGIIGPAIEVVDTSTDFSAASHDLKSCDSSYCSA